MLFTLGTQAQITLNNNWANGGVLASNGFIAGTQGTLIQEMPAMASVDMDSSRNTFVLSDNENYHGIKKYDKFGNVDNSFHFEADLSTNIHENYNSIQVLSDYKILVAGGIGGDLNTPFPVPFLARLNPNGTRDITFNEYNQNHLLNLPGFTYSFLGDIYPLSAQIKIVKQVNNMIYLFGEININKHWDAISGTFKVDNREFIAKLDANGNPDISFGNQGVLITNIENDAANIDESEAQVTIPPFQDILIDDFSNIFVCGEFGVHKINANGTINTTFAPNIPSGWYVNSMQNINSEFILVGLLNYNSLSAGTQQNEVWKIKTTTGALDINFANAGKITYTSFPPVWSQFSIPRTIVFLEENTSNFYTVINNFNNIEFYKYDENGQLVLSFFNNGNTYFYEGNLCFNTSVNPFVVKIIDGYFQVFEHENGVIYQFNMNNVLGLNDNFSNNTYMVYPNPTNQNIVISNSNQQEYFTYKIVSPNGSILLNSNNWQNQSNVNIKSLSAGNYILQITDQKNNTISKKITVSKN